MPPFLVGRSALAGVLMGLANLVPGISGGTMLLAAGVYPRFVEAVAEISTFRFRREPIVVLVTVVASAMVAVLLLAGVVKDLVVEHRWVMYSLFIGLTLGGVPVVWRLVRPASRAVFVSAGIGFVAMAALALLETRGATGTGGVGSSPLLLGLGGLAGASAMILPGISGGYLLLVLGQYVPILAGIDALKNALAARDAAAALEPAIGVVLPVGIGVVVGVVAISSLLRWLLRRHPKPTLGALLGLLLGAVVGLWPFQRPLEPTAGETIVRGRVLTVETIGEVDPEDLPTERFRPRPSQLAGALGLVVAGFLVTSLVARVGGSSAPEIRRTSEGPS